MWGRNEKPSVVTVCLTGGLLYLCPVLVAFFWNCCHRQGASFTGLLYQVRSFGVLSILPRPTGEALLIFVGWMLLQVLLFVHLPGPLVQGQETPAGNVLEYRVNGLCAWGISNGLFAALGLLGLIQFSVIADNWEGLLVAANLYGFALAVFVFVKAHIQPTHRGDIKFSGSQIYDFFMGIEINPRIGAFFDLKLFHNGRPGIVAWTMINASFAAAQYNRFGLVTDSMILVNILHTLYVLDFFVHEDWYLKTIDISHEHFGFNLSWGDSVWLPFMYTLQTQYLSHNPITLGILFWPILLLGLVGYCIFREANFQKDVCRRTGGMCHIWGRPAKIIRTEFTSADGKRHKSVLLTSGLWGVSRHCNYLGDLILSLAMCLACGTHHVLPYFYILYMTILLMHRIERDHQRCKGKYGPYWTDYCRQVPFKLIPAIY
jgi:7-dehydrocholesterol reductase